MIEKIRTNLSKGRYSKQLPSASFEAYINKNGGWKDCLISNKIIFSHRENDYSEDYLPEKLHSHDYYELTFVFSRDGVEYTADGQCISLRKGMAVLTKPMRFHMFRLTRDMHYDRYVMYFKDIDGIFPDSAVMSFTKMGNSSCAVFELPEQTLLSRLKSVEDALTDTESPYASARAYLNICHIFVLLSDQKATVEEDIPIVAPNFISEIKEYIDKNFLEINSIEALSKQFFYSREYISRSFRKYYNTPIYDYVLNRKIQHSSLLLKQGASVRDSAHSSGFSNISSFIKLFRKYFGCTPSEYKAKYM